MINLKEMLKEDFGVDLPIRGGHGNSIDNPIIIEKAIPNNYVDTEMAVIKFIGLGRRIGWKIFSQQLIIHNNRFIDKIQIEYNREIKMN
ncbi:MAG: hypothetical protein ACR2GN_05230 [Bacteroidia bacterium]